MKRKLNGLFAIVSCVSCRHQTSTDHPTRIRSQLVLKIEICSQFELGLKTVGDRSDTFPKTYRFSIRRYDFRSSVGQPVFLNTFLRVISSKKKKKLLLRCTDDLRLAPAYVSSRENNSDFTVWTWRVHVQRWIICRNRRFQYSGWEKKEVDDIYSNQKQLSDVVADYFFVCPTNLFANIVSSRGARVYYYFFTHVSRNNPRRPGL